MRRPGPGPATMVGERSELPGWPVQLLRVVWLGLLAARLLLPGRGARADYDEAVGAFVP